MPRLGESRAAAWRMANVDLRNLRYDCLLLGMAIPTQSYVRYDSFGITRERHARRLRYTTMSGRMDVIYSCNRPLRHTTLHRHDPARLCSLLRGNDARTLRQVTLAARSGVLTTNA